MRLRGAALAGAAAACIAAAPASAFPVVSGQLDYTTANVYDTTAPADTDRTWLGYTVRFAAPGTADPILPATGPSVTLLSPFGPNALYTWTHPAALAAGTYDPDTGVGVLEYTGGVRFASTAHGFNLTFENPRIVLDGTRGQLFASGTKDSGAATYDRSKPVYDLDLSKATVTRTPTSVQIAGIVPRIATEGHAYASSYAAGEGPERTPNTFGSFGLSACASAVCAAPGAAPPPAATATPSPTASPVATPRPPRPRASQVALTRRKLTFRLNRVVRTQVRIARAAKQVSALRFTPASTSVSVKLALEPGRYRVTVKPEGGSPLSTLRSVR